MATSTEIKLQIDNDITDQTADNSVTQVNVGNRMKDTVDYTVQEIETLQANIDGNSVDIASNGADISTNVTGILANNSAINGCTKNADTDVSANDWVLDEDDMVSDSDTKVPTQQSVKAYVDAQAGDGTDDLEDVCVRGSSTSQMINALLGFKAAAGIAYSILRGTYLEWVNSGFKLEIFPPTLTEDQVITYPDNSGEVVLHGVTAPMVFAKQLWQSGTDDPVPQFGVDEIAVGAEWIDDTAFRDIKWTRLGVGLYSCKLRYTPATVPTNFSKFSVNFGGSACRITNKYQGGEGTPPYSYVDFRFSTYTPAGVLSDDQMLGNNGDYVYCKLYK